MKYFDKYIENEIIYKRNIFFKKLAFQIIIQIFL